MTHTTNLTAAITISDNKLSIGERTTATIRFSEAIDASSFTTADLTVGGGAQLSNLRSTDGGTTWEVTLTAPGNPDPAIINPSTVRSSMGNQIRVNLAGLTNRAGNAGVGEAVSTVTYDIDARRPMATITLADSALTAGETTTVTFTFSEPVTGLDSSDVNLSHANGTLGPLTPNANRTAWTATFTPTANVNDTTNTISVNLRGVSDLAGNAGARTTTSANYTVDTRNTTGPTATITLADSTLTVGEASTTVTFRFSKPVNGFDTSDIVYTSGTLTTPTANAERTVWTATFTPLADITVLTNTIHVNLAGVTDDAGNAGTGRATSANYSVDKIRPTATSVTLADRVLTAGESTTVTFSFSEPVNGFDARDIVCSNGTLSTPTPMAHTERTVWTATFTPTANVNAGANTIRVNATGLTDDAGNAGTGSVTSANYTVDTRDTTGPTVTITLADSALTAGETTTITFRFNEPVNDFYASDVAYTNGMLTTPRANTERTVWTSTFTPRANANAPINTIRVLLTGVIDDAGNAGTGIASSANYSVNTIGPTAAITLADSAFTAGETTTVTFRFSEPVSGFDASDINLSNANGSLGPLTPNANRMIWTATYTPTANVSAGANTIRVNLAGVRDDAGNAGTGNASSAYYSVDTVRPTVTITLADSVLTVGETTTVTFRFNGPVNDFDTDDIVYTNGTLTMPVANAERTVWTATYTPAEDISARVNTIRVNLAGVTNDAGNAGTGSASSANYSVDNTRPTVFITLADSALTAGETTTVTFRFNEPVNGLDTSDIVCPNGRLSTPVANAERTLWTATLTPNAHANARTNAIRVDLTGVRDDAGNAGTGRASSTNYSVHTTRPTATITLADSTLTAGESTTVRFIFNEPVNGLDASDIVCPNGRLSPPTANAERTLWTATLTPNAGANAATNTIRVDLAGVTNDTGNAGTGRASSDNYSVDTVRPTATITLADNALTVDETTTVSFRFNEPVTGLDASDVVLTEANGTLGTLTHNGERTVWTATFTPTANVSVLANTIRVNLSGVSDDAGNAGTGRASSTNYSVHTTRPTVTIALADSTLTAGESTTVRFIFNEPVNGLDASDIVCPNGRLSPPTANAERTLWTATLTPNAGANAATNTIRVDLAGVTNDTGNAGTGSASSANYSVDTVRPTATITLADSALTVDETTTVSFRFNKPVNGFDTDDIVYTNGTLTTPTANAARTVWTATYTPAEDISARVNTIRVNLAGVTDDAGNTGTGSAISANYSVDNTRPTATSITLADSALTAGETTTVSFRFNEPVNGLDTSDIVCPNGRLSTPVANAERTLWTATLTPNAHANARTNAIRVDLTGVRDDAGNAGTGRASSTNYSVHTTRPTVTIALADSTLTAGESTTVRFIFNEPVNGLDASDIVCPNGRLSPPTANAERTLWTATLTPNAGANAATNTIRVDLAGVTNDTGNAGTGRASSDNYSVDTVRPTATITLADNALTVDETTTVSFRFNEPVTGLDASDVVLTEANGTLGTLTHNGERTVWTATFTPTANVSTPTNTIRVNLSGVSDDAGNAGTGSASSTNYSVDTVRPTATITLADSALTADETTTVSFRFNEPVTDFDASDIDLSNANGTLGPLTPNANRMAWTATYTPTANVSAGANTIRVNLAGVRDDAGNAGSSSVTSANYSVDTVRPWNGFDASDIDLWDASLWDANDIDLSDANGTLGPLTPNADRTVWTATLTPTANVYAPTNAIRVNLAGVTDDAGTAGTGSATSENYYVNTVRPTMASITLADSTLTAGETTTVTFRFSEPVSDFYATSIVCSNGTLSPPMARDSGSGSTVWTATFTPTANVYAPTNAIRVNLAGVASDVDNTGTETATSANYSVDTRPANTTGPTATITLADTSLTVGESTTITFAFSEPVTGFTRDDIVLTDANGALDEPTTHDNGRTWTAAFTPTANVENSSNTIGVNLAGVTNAAGRAGTGHANSTNYQIDTRAPVVVSASVDNEWLDLYHTEGTYLDETHIPPATAFAVRVDNVLTAVTAVRVDSWIENYVVRLMLATPVANDQQVTIAYTDPTTGNDANAIQDAAGNDAASFSAMAVENNTRAPQSQARSAPLTPSTPADPTNKNTQDDTDSDDIPNNAKDQLPHTPSPADAAPATGNSNDIPDSTHRRQCVQPASCSAAAPPEQASQQTQPATPP
ncbi:Ig-like domain-containing protein [Verminephrobacter aporrectodeae]|uniref:Ig-like domain-containing protein n=1 Tax=Verminephrobacter aporrectodeae TaxID=1110389 RepID=UPI0022379366|nr:Ig-like domain-containing protein [Verminephrobacter aporrectodeae]MCW5223621.1 glycosyl hydrolase [Verminephrobacter aporrectodeae subsp. tuberculatae]